MATRQAEADTKEDTAIRSAKVRWQPVVASALLLAFVFFATAARGEEPRVQPGGGVTAPEHGDVAETGKKLSNPLSDIWALFTEFDLSFSNGNPNSGHDQVGGRMIFQPILPFPLYGRGENEWRFITRPTIPFHFSEPIPTGPDNFDHKGGLGDTQVPEGNHPFSLRGHIPVAARNRRSG